MDIGDRRTDLIDCQLGRNEFVIIGRELEQLGACSTIPSFDEDHTVGRQHESKLARAICNEIGKQWV